jgi:hypothetical protein
VLVLHKQGLSHRPVGHTSSLSKTAAMAATTSAAV